MLIAAATMYLPNHLVLISNRIWYYVHGEFANITGNAASELLKGVREEIAATQTKNVVAETADKVLRNLREL